MLGSTSELDNRLTRFPVAKFTSPANSNSCSEVQREIGTPRTLSDRTAGDFQGGHSVGMIFTDGRFSSSHSSGKVATVNTNSTGTKLATRQATTLPRRKSA